jgi:hypothetical protein
MEPIQHHLLGYIDQTKWTGISTPTPKSNSVPLTTLQRWLASIKKPGKKTSNNNDQQAK